MKSFDVLTSPVGGCIAVKSGWCWPAFFFGVLWMLFSQLWLRAVIFFVLMLGVNFILGFIIVFLINSAPYSDFAYYAMIAFPFLSTLVGLGFGLIFGSKGNMWRKNSLLSKGYSYVGTAPAASKEDAVFVLARAGQSSSPAAAGMRQQMKSLSSSSSQTAPRAF